MHCFHYGTFSVWNNIWRFKITHSKENVFKGDIWQRHIWLVYLCYTWMRSLYLPAKNGAAAVAAWSLVNKLCGVNQLAYLLLPKEQLIILPESDQASLERTQVFLNACKAVLAFFFFFLSHSDLFLPTPSNIFYKKKIW